MKLINKRLVMPIFALCILFGASDAYADGGTQRQQCVTVGAQPIQRSQLWITLVHVAIYDAVMSIDGRYEQFKVTPAHLRPASLKAAAIAAAHGVLVRLLPGQQISLDAERAISLAAIQNGIKKDNGIAIGEEVAQRLLEIHDGVIPTVTYTPGTNPGDWQPTPPAFAPALLPGWGQVTPFGLLEGSQFRAPAPPELCTGKYANDYNEVKLLGRIDSPFRPQDRTDVARFYAATGPVSVFNSGARQVSAAQGRTLSENARMFALLAMAIGDAQIAVYDTKYYYNFWRPFIFNPAATT